MSPIPQLVEDGQENSGMSKPARRRLAADDAMQLAGIVAHLQREAGVFEPIDQHHAEVVAARARDILVAVAGRALHDI